MMMKDKTEMAQTVSTASIKRRTMYATMATPVNDDHPCARVTAFFVT